MNDRMNYVWVILLLSAFSLAACSSNSSESKPDLEMLKDHVWTLQSFGPVNRPQQVIKDYQPTLSFDFESETASGNSSCNHYTASFTIKGSNLNFSQAMSTLMACVDQLAMKQENDYLNLISRVNSYKFEGATLVLLTDSSDVLLFSRSD